MQTEKLNIELSNLLIFISLDHDVPDPGVGHDDPEAGPAALAADHEDVQIAPLVRLILREVHRLRDPGKRQMGKPS